MKSKSYISILAIAVALLMVTPSFAQFIPVSEAEASCTSIMVGKKATTDGSVITSHSCDGNYRTWLNIVPHKTWPANSMRKVTWGNMHTEFPTDRRNLIDKGEIPQVAETFAYFVYSPKPTGNTIKDQKILFFYNYPEFVQARDQILNNTCAAMR